MRHFKSAVILFGIMACGFGHAYNCPEYGLDFGGNDIHDVPYGIPGVNQWEDCGNSHVCMKVLIYVMVQD